MRKTLSAAITLICLLSCNSDNEQESSLNMIVDGTWYLSGIFTNITDTNGESAEINIFDLPLCPECIKDDQIEISSDGMYSITLGDIRCDDGKQIFKFPHEGTWKFTHDEHGIVLNPDSPDSTYMDINTLTDKELKLTYIDTIPQTLFINDSLAHEISILYKHQQANNQATN